MTAKIYQFEELLKYSFIRHGVSTRHGGVSESYLTSSLNLGLKTADSKQQVKENYKRFCDAAGLTYENMVHAKQEHGANVREITSADAGKGLFRNRDYENVDALVTKEKNIPLVITTADCVPVLFADVKNKIIGAAHCGWRGTLAALAANTVSEMVRLGGTAENIIAAICPCARSCCYEVSEELALDFKNKTGVGVYEKNGGFYIDLPQINKHFLKSAGILENNIYDCGICTICNGDDYFSHRVLGDGRGMIGSAIELVSANIY